MVVEADAHHPALPVRDRLFRIAATVEDVLLPQHLAVCTVEFVVRWRRTISERQHFFCKQLLLDEPVLPFSAIAAIGSVDGLLQTALIAFQREVPRIMNEVDRTGIMISLEHGPWGETADVKIGKVMAGLVGFRHIVWAQGAHHELF